MSYRAFIVVALLAAVALPAAAQEKKGKRKKQEQGQTAATLTPEQQRAAQVQQIQQQMANELAAADQQLTQDLRALWNQTRNDPTPDRYEQQRAPIIQRRDQAGVAVNQKYGPQLSALGGSSNALPPATAVPAAAAVPPAASVPGASGDRGRQLADIDEQIAHEQRRHKEKTDDLKRMQASQANRTVGAEELRSTANQLKEEQDRHEKAMRELENRRRQLGA